MNTVLLEIINKNPWLLYVIIGTVFISLAFLIVTAMKTVSRGIPFEFYGLKLGRKNGESTQKFQASITQSPTIIINPTGQGLTDEQVERVIEKTSKLRQNTDEETISKYLSPKLSDKVSYVHSIPLDIRDRLAKIVLGVGGGWAGCSNAPLEIFLDYGRRFIGESTYQEIIDLLTMIDVYRYFEEAISTQDMIRIQYLNADVNINLEKTYNELVEKGEITNQSN